MPEYEYVDEQGRPIDPSELGDDVEYIEYVDDDADDLVEADEITDVPDAEPVSRPVTVDDGVDLDGVVIEDAPTPSPSPSPSAADATTFAADPAVRDQTVAVAEPELPKLGRKGALILAGVGVAAVAVLGGVVFGLANIGSQNTVADLKAGAQSKYAQASSSVVAKSSEVRGEAESVTIDACAGSLVQARATASPTPTLRLDVISSVPLPGAFVSAAAANADGQPGEVSLLQLAKTGWGIYTTTPLTRAEATAKVDRPGYHKADVTVDGDSVRVTGDRVWAGGDTAGAGSCAPGDPGVYLATGKIPADAAGLVDGQASVTAIQGVAGQKTKAVAVMGNSVVLVRLVEAEPEGGEASSSSAVPSK